MPGVSRDVAETHLYVPGTTYHLFQLLGQGNVTNLECLYGPLIETFKRNVLGKNIKKEKGTKIGWVSNISSPNIK